MTDSRTTSQPGEAGDTADTPWFAAAAAAAFDAVVGLAPDGTITAWNAAAERIYGHPASAAIGRDIALLASAEEAEELRVLLARLACGGEGVSGLAAVLVHRDGRPVEVTVSVAPVVAGGAMVGAVLIARDDTAANRAARELAHSRERLAAALFASEIGTFRWEIDTDRLEWDENLRRLFGLPADATIGRIADFLGHVHPDDRDALVAEVRRCIAERTPLAKEFRILRADGTERWISDKARAFYDDDGRPLYLTGACRDVTARKAVEAELSAALAAKDLLLREVNHRVKNSLQLVSSLLRLQGLNMPGGEARQHFVEACRRVDMVARVHERLYKTDNVGTVDFGAFLRDLCADAAAVPSAAARRPAVAVSAAEIDLASDRAIPLALVINELLINALKYAYPDGAAGEIRVVSEVPGDGGLRVRVEDDGVGLPAGFDPAAAGSLGMKLVVALSRQAGADLTIEPRPTGAAFRLDLAVGR